MFICVSGLGLFVLGEFDRVGTGVAPGADGQGGVLSVHLLLPTSQRTTHG